jgi:hypothetical protein
MKKVTLLCGLLLALTATVASAAGVGLRWNSCNSDPLSAINKNFACNSNTIPGGATLVGSFTLGAAGLAQTSGNEVVIDLAAAGATLPAWWQFKNPGTCRGAAMTMNFTGPAACVDWALGSAVGGIGAYNIGQRGPNTARVVAAFAVAPDNLQDLSGGQEYFSFNLALTGAKTVGTGACGGCQTPVCLVFNSINLTTPILANNIKLSGSESGADADFATWQGGVGVTVPGAPPGCGAATPTQNKTWGAVKSMYHN